MYFNGSSASSHIMNDNAVAITNLAGNLYQVIDAADFRIPGRSTLHELESSLTVHRSSCDHDDRYYTKAEINKILQAYYSFHAISITDCLTQTGMPGVYIFNDSAVNRPEEVAKRSGCIFTFGHESFWTIRIAVTNTGGMYVSLYEPGHSWGSWKAV